MSTLVNELERELSEFDPVTVRQFERTVREMLLLAKMRRPVREGAVTLPLKVHSMGAFCPGIDPHKLGQLADDF